jgi:phosphoribosyl-AMP cyclohydrolase
MDAPPQQSPTASLTPPDPRLASLKLDANGLIPAIIQDHKTGQVLMMAWMNRDSLARTIQIGKTHFFSRSRNKLWLKGESSGHVQHVKSIATDCDKDVLLIKVEQVGAACHEGYESCFFRELEPLVPGLTASTSSPQAASTSSPQAVSGQEPGWKVVGKLVFDPKKVYAK